MVVLFGGLRGLEFGLIEWPSIIPSLSKTLPCSSPQIISIPNSMTVLPELLPIAVTLALRRLAGPINFTNPGAISHNEILELCREYVYPDLEWSNFTVEEQNKILKAPRSNNTLDTSKVMRMRCVLCDSASEMVMLSDNVGPIPIAFRSNPKFQTFSLFARLSLNTCLSLPANVKKKSLHPFVSSVNND